MCVVERKTYIHSDGRREVVEKNRRCHNAPKNGLCAYVEHTTNSARVVEVRPSPTRGSPSSGEILTTGRDGRPRRYETVSRKNSTRAPSRRTSGAGERSPADSMSPPAPRTQEVKPPAPMPPTVAGGYPSARRSATLSPTQPPDPNVRVGPGGTAVYDRPPSLDMPRAEINERPHLSRPSSFDSTSADIDHPQQPTPPPSFRQRRPSSVVIDVDVASANVPASGYRSSPGLGNLPNPFAETLPRDSKGKSRSRVDSAAEGVRRQQQQDEDDRQARLEVDKLAEVERRQRARVRKADEAAAEARERAAEIERERADSSRERKERERRRAAAVLDGETRARQEAEMERKINAELNQIAREKAEADARRLEQQQQQYQPIRPSAAPMTSPRTSYISARNMSPNATATTTISARGPTFPPYSVTVHNYPSARKYSNSISDRGEAVIAREQARAASERMSDAMGGMQLREDDVDDDDDNDDEALDAAISAGMRRTASRRTRNEGKERERAQREQRERRLRDEGYF